MVTAAKHGGLALSTLCQEDEYGFERGEEFDAHSYEEFMSQYLSVLARRSKKWEKVLQRPLKKSTKLRRYCRKGIPSKSRHQVWFQVSSTKEFQDQFNGTYKSFLMKPLKPEQEDSILLDLPRTFPENSQFKGIDSIKRKSLRNVLLAFINLQPQIGYCQGLNYIAGLMLLVVPDEETAFWLFSHLVTNLIPPYYGPNMIGLLAEIHTISSILRERKPVIWKHLQYYDLDLSIVLTKWFVCLFVGVLPIETVLRVWDCLFYEGSIIMIRVTYGLILMHEKEIFMSQSFPALVTCFKSMTNSMRSLKCHTFMEEVFKLTKGLPLEYINKLRKEGEELEKAKQMELDTKRKMAKTR